MDTAQHTSGDPRPWLFLGQKSRAKWPPGAGCRLRAVEVAAGTLSADEAACRDYCPRSLSRESRPASALALTCRSDYLEHWRRRTWGRLARVLRAISPRPGPLEISDRRHGPASGDIPRYSFSVARTRAMRAFSLLIVVSSSSRAHPERRSIREDVMTDRTSATSVPDAFDTRYMRRDSQSWLRAWG